MKNPFSAIRVFVREMWDELLKCAWPTWAELGNSTLIVIVAAIIMGVFTSISDFSLYQVVDLLTSWVS
ncbi:MAG: preprotein translocase subunit SecE [Verrucomicrobia bacterium]|nr:preprotein translocase subunit SecE [Verrucomicrobiota bacterium]